MPRWILIMLIILWGVLAVQGQSTNAELETGWTAINLRAEPSVNAAVVGELSGGAAILVTGRTADYVWYRVQLSDGRVAWLASRYVTLLVPQREIPVVDASAPVVPVENNPAPVNSGAASNGTVTAASLNLRNAPSVDATALLQLGRGTGVIILARSADNVWLQVQTTNGQSGWLAARYVRTDLALGSIPIAGSNPETSVNNPAPVNQSFFTLGSAAQSIFVRGQALGNRANVFSKVGDSMTVAEEMYRPIGYGVYNLGAYGHLQTTINFFMAGAARAGNPFSNVSLAANGGWNTETVLNPQFADSSVCAVGESPLACEYRLNKPAVALIMLGSNDTTFIVIEQFGHNMRLIANASIEAGVIPVLSTIPPRAHHPGRAEAYNQVILALAQELGLPVWDYYSALMTLPNAGMSEDGLHVSSPPEGFVNGANFTGDFLQYGYVMRNLTMLQVLDALRVNVLQ